MARKTKKFVAGLSALFDLGLNVSWGTAGMAAEDLYRMLAEQGMVWDSKQGRWIVVADEPADEPGKTIRIRVWADAEIVNEAADQVVWGLGPGWQVIERSEPYACRPPRQLEARVYLTVLPPGK